jgi:hypothetical protein
VSAPQVWKRPNSPGDIEAVKGMGGVVAPLLAGFCLATIAVLMTSTNTAKTPLAVWATLCLTGAAVLFLYTVQYSFLAVRSGSPPSAYLDWQTEARLDPKRMHKLRREQAQDRELFNRYQRRAGAFFTLGMWAFLAGLALVLVPHQWQFMNVVAVSGVGIAFFVEVLWWLSGSPPVVCRLTRLIGRVPLIVWLGHFTRLIPLIKLLGRVAQRKLTPGREDVEISLDEMLPDDLRRLGLFVPPEQNGGT